VGKEMEVEAKGVKGVGNVVKEGEATEVEVLEKEEGG